MLLGASVPGIDQVPRDIDPQHVCAKFRLGNCRSAVPTSQIQHLHSFRDSEFLHQRFSAFAHRVCDAPEIAFFPECFVRIHGTIHNTTLFLDLYSGNASGERARLACWFARPTQTNFNDARVRIADNIAFRYSPIVSDSVKYITDDRGERTAVVVPIADYEKLLEDLEDLAVVVERREEPTIPHEQFVSEIKRDGLL